LHAVDAIIDAVEQSGHCQSSARAPDQYRPGVAKMPSIAKVGCCVIMEERLAGRT